MVGRPCKPDPDVNRLWRTLLPDMPAPSCDMASDRSADPIEERRDRGPNQCERAEQSWLGKFAAFSAQLIRRTPRAGG
jgi:hypothetical protein